MPIQADHAIVVGGSMAGLMAARVLSDHVERVTIIDRDELPDGPAYRRGVPQGPHLHGLLYGGRLTLDELYDGDFTDATRAAGGPYFDFHRHQAYLFPEGWIRRAPSDLWVVFASRPVLEDVIRRLTTRVANIELRVGQVTGLVVDARGERVTGVAYEDDGSGASVLEADLVIDAAGRGSKSPKWLEDRGYAPPQESVVQPFLGYSTVFCTVPEDAWPGDIRSVAAAPFPGTTRGGFAVPQENGILGLMAAGTSRDYPPSDKEGFTEFLRTAVTTVFYDMWMASEPISEIRTTKTSVNRLRRWDQLERHPDRFIAMGDAVAAYNPVYGQGITTAALQAKVLRDRLREADTLESVVAGMRDDAMRVCAFAWSAATESDMAFAATEVRNMTTSATEEEATEYFRTVRRLTTEDPYVAQEFYRAMGLMKPEMLFTPELGERVAEAAAQPVKERGDVTQPPPWADTEAPTVASGSAAAR